MRTAPRANVLNVFSERVHCDDTDRVGGPVWRAPGIKWKFVEADAALYETLKAKLPYGSLPLLEIDGLELVQPGAIVRYLARRAKTFPATPSAAWSFDALLDACEEMRLANMNVRGRIPLWFALDACQCTCAHAHRRKKSLLPSVFPLPSDIVCLSFSMLLAASLLAPLPTRLVPAPTQAMPEYSGTGHSAKLYKDTVLAGHLAQFEALLAKSGPDYYVGNTFSFADLVVFNVVRTAAALVPGVLAAYPKLTAFVDRIAAREKIAAYLASSKHLAAPAPLA